LAKERVLAGIKHDDKDVGEQPDSLEEWHVA